jgi:hypothetical protein
VSLPTCVHSLPTKDPTDSDVLKTMRPPYGDIDDRVRYISLQMGLTPIIWTAADGNTFGPSCPLLPAICTDTWE